MLTILTWILCRCLFAHFQQFGSVQSLSRVRLFGPHEPQHARPPCPSPTPGVHPNPCPLSRWCHPTIPSCVVLFSSCPQSFPASGSFQMSQLFASDGQSIGVSASTSVLPILSTRVAISHQKSQIWKYQDKIMCFFFPWWDLDLSIFLFLVASLTFWS